MSSSTHPIVNPEPGEVHRGDPAYRRNVGLVVLVLIIGGLAVSWLLPHWLADLHKSLTGSAAAREAFNLRLGFSAIATTLALAALLGARMAFRWSARIADEQAYPASEEVTARDVPVRRGAPALLAARWHRRAGWLSVGIAMALIAWTAWIWIGA